MSLIAQCSALSCHIKFAFPRCRQEPSALPSTIPTLGWTISLLTPSIAPAFTSAPPSMSQAFMLASKIICNDTYSNKSWCIIGQGMFALQEI
ncbi:hypothetical protein BJY52DRAFT_1194778 [Lactarius psammicola]|nr:hypothetical protein BJY52DRAFT_1194778 [Lactarius psammicola]